MSLYILSLQEFNCHFLKELGLTDVNFKAIINSNCPAECSSSVKDILRTCGEQKNTLC